MNQSTVRIAALGRRLGRSCGLALVFLAGCMSEQGALEQDPIRGGPAIPSRPPAPTSGSPAGALTSSSDVAPVPSPYSPTGVAALAAGDPRTPTTSATSGAVLRPPQPTDATARLAPAPAAPTPPAPPTPAVTLTGATQPAPAPAVPAALQTATYEQLQTMLAQRNVTWQRLEMIGDQGEWQFMCAIPNPSNPRMRRNYVARVAGPGGLAAIRAAIAEIDLATGKAAPATTGWSR